jgi:hypothetical protein
MTSADRLRLWSAELFRALLPAQDVPGTPVLLACDDETIRTVAERLGLDYPDPSIQFGRDVAVAFQVGLRSGWKTVVCGPWEKAAPPRELPVFFPVLCLWVLAATRMAPDEKHPTMEYHGRLCELVGVPGDDSLECFNFIGPRFRDFAEWLEQDMQGRHGHLIVPASPHPAHVGFAVEQTVFRLRDRQVLSVFFTERLRGSLDGFDPLRRLQRWSGRGQLTGHALRIVENPQFEDRVRAAIRSAFGSWDGAELVETSSGRLGRVWPAYVRLRPQPIPRLQFGAGNQKPVEFTLEGEAHELDVDSEIELPWAVLARLEHRSVDLGDPRSPSGGVRLPRLGSTIIFENTDEGLLQVERPAAEKVWVLTHDGALQEQLKQRRFNDGGALPFGWELFFNVPVADLPGVSRAPVADAVQTPLRLEGGLPLGRPRYLSGYPPFLVAGDLETSAHLPVRVNDQQHGYISSGGRLPLPDTAGRYDVEVGEGDFRVSYDIEERGEPQEELLWHELDGEHALRRGARPAEGDETSTRVCGAALLPPFAGALPFLTSVRCNVESICANGGLVAHARPSTPAWFKEVGLDGDGRWWELLCGEEIMWVLMPPAGGKPRVRMLVDRPLAQLEPDAADRVRELGEDVQFVGANGRDADVRGRWLELVALARGAKGGAAA